jgi:hypothetical protein
MVMMMMMLRRWKPSHFWREAARPHRAARLGKGGRGEVEVGFEFGFEVGGGGDVSDEEDRARGLSGGGEGRPLLACGEGRKGVRRRIRY